MTRRGGGFALLTTLWFLVAISVVGLEWGLRARDQRRVVLNAVDAVDARAAAEAGMAEALARLDDVLRQANAHAGAAARMADGRYDALFRHDPWHDPRVIVPDTEWAGTHVEWHLHLEDAGTRLNLNLASVDELRRFLVALRVDAGRADEIAESVADWRDADDAHRPHGAERNWYLRAGRLVLPRNAPFGTVEELKRVRGVTSTVYQRVAPLLTVLGDGRINLMAASRPVLLALPGIGEEAVRVLQMRRIGGRSLPLVTDLEQDLSPGAQAEFERALPQLLTQATTETREVRITSKGWVAGSPAQVRADAIAVRGLSAASLVEIRVAP